MGMGFEYAYQYPGMNKVLQAAGRVIRTETDRGLVLLIDSRYRTGQLPPVVPPPLVSSAADRERGTALCTAGRLLGRAAFQACFSQIAYKRKTRPASTRPGAFLIVESTKPSAPIRRVTPLRRLPCAAGWCPPAERLCTEC